MPRRAAGPVSESERQLVNSNRRLRRLQSTPLLGQVNGQELVLPAPSDRYVPSIDNSFVFDRVFGVDAAQKEALGEHVV